MLAGVTGTGTGAAAIPGWMGAALPGAPGFGASGGAAVVLVTAAGLFSVLATTLLLGVLAS